MAARSEMGDRGEEGLGGEEEPSGKLFGLAKTG